MSERKPGATPAAMSRTAFLRNLALLGGAIGVAGLDLPALLGLGRAVPAPGRDPDAERLSAAPATITPPARSVKRRG